MNIRSMIESPLGITRIVVAVIVLLVIAALAVYITNRHARKQELLSAPPLNLTDEQQKHTTVRHHRNPVRVTVRIPAQYTTDSAINEWADLAVRRIGAGYQVEVRVIPQSTFHHAMYEIVFTRLDDLR